MKWNQLPLGELQTNCYVAFEEENSTCIIFDPGAEGEKVANWLEERNLTPIAILLTHAHFDHIGGVEYLRKQYNIPVYIHKNEKEWLKNPILNASQLFFPNNPIKVNDADHIIEEEGELIIGNFRFTVFETPGHSPGSLSFYTEDSGVVFSGDTVFLGSVGRTDLPYGDYMQLMKSIREKLLTLPKQTKLLPGHGPITTIENELGHNPFLQELK